MAMRLGEEGADDGWLIVPRFYYYYFVFSSWLFLLVYPLAHGVCVDCIGFFVFLPA